mgnify:FL=1
MEDQFATIYKLGKCNLAKVIEHRERAVQLDPVNANFLHRLASDYFDDSQIARAVETQERVVALRPDSEIAAQKLEEYRAALKD